MLERGAVTSEQGVLLSHSMGSLWGCRSFWPGTWDQEGPRSARAGLCSPALATKEGRQEGRLERGCFQIHSAWRGN